MGWEHKIRRCVAAAAAAAAEERREDSQLPCPVQRPPDLVPTPCEAFVEHSFYTRLGHIVSTRMFLGMRYFLPIGVQKT